MQGDSIFRVTVVSYTQSNDYDGFALVLVELGPSSRWMVTGWLIGLGQAMGGSGASRSCVGTTPRWVGASHWVGGADGAVGGRPEGEIGTRD